MKIRIKGNTVRFRITKTEVAHLCVSGYIEERTYFLTSQFIYAVKASDLSNLNIDFEGNKIEVLIPQKVLSNWENNNRVGFNHSIKAANGEMLNILIEKDFVCLDDRGEDESDNYPNPKLQKS